MYWNLFATVTYLDYFTQNACIQKCTKIKQQQSSALETVGRITGGKITFRVYDGVEKELVVKILDQQEVLKLFVYVLSGFFLHAVFVSFVLTCETTQITISTRIS
eukprot:TRINITY_DN39855_c0_g1_i3.p5 TRINITY_DN39855_c0_g1~~TRINITY_DN39855_c0_g1_i3.p5  ORF type:complete len:105 (-),score=0.31 TRINITY_DN39855_c0_g1_i3:81-395(-)